MMRAMLSGVSGLKAHQEKMDVIGNNIANINTTGYKASRVTFSDIFSQTLSSATSSNSTTGAAGSNAKQVGLGSQVSSIDTLMTQGSTESTGNDLDLAINGSGFFIVRNGTTGSYMFTRDGSFDVDENGNLNSNGMNVYGWTNYEKQADGTYKFNTDSQVVPINLYSDSDNGNKQIIAGEATSGATFAGSLDSSAATGDTYNTTMTVYDKLGNSHELNLVFTKGASSGTGSTWTYTITDPSTTAAGTFSAGSTGTLTFGTDGSLTSPTTTSTLTYVPNTSTGTDTFNITLDLTTLTTTSGTSTVKASDVDGCESGTLDSYSIDGNGVITGVYSNGLEQPLGMVALAQFDNPAGLQSAGSNYYTTSQNSGEFANGVAANNTLESGCLEMSNVDLSTEFASMIVTQRGYQANSRIITACDEMLQTVLDMKR